MVLPKIEFEFNCAKNRSTKFSLFEVVLSNNPCGPLDLINDKKHKKVEDLVQDLIVIHAHANNNLVDAYAQHKSSVCSFEDRDEVWVYLSKERHPHGEYHKFKHKKIGPCEIFVKFDDNVYKVKLPPDLHIGDTFNACHLQPCYREFKLENATPA